MSTEVHVGDIGTKFLVTINENGVAFDISTCTVKQIIFRKPSGVLLTKTATFNSSGVDGKLYYLTLATDLDIPGTWMLQASVVLPSGSWKTSTALFEVVDNL